MTTLAEVLEYLDLEQKDAENVSAFVQKHGNQIYGINFHGAVMPYLLENKTLKEVYEEDPEYYDEFTPAGDFVRGFLLGEIDVFFEITEF